MTTKKKKAGVLLVDDHPIVREGLEKVINAEADLIVCGEAESAVRALRAIEKLKPDLAIVDISLHELNGIELIKDLKIRHPKLPVLVLSAHDEFLYAERCLHAGAKGYIMKHETGQKLLRAIRTVLRGEIYLSQAMTKQMLQMVTTTRVGKPVSFLKSLSDREFEIFEFIGKGKRTKAIAEILHLSPKTVEYHRENIKRKLGVKTATELLEKAIQLAQSGIAR